MHRTKKTTIIRKGKLAFLELEDNLFSTLSHVSPQSAAGNQPPQLDTQQFGELSHLLLAGQEVQDRFTKVLFYFLQLSFT